MSCVRVCGCFVAVLSYNKFHVRVVVRPLVYHSSTNVWCLCASVPYSEYPVYCTKVVHVHVPWCGAGDGGRRASEYSHLSLARMRVRLSAAALHVGRPSRRYARQQDELQLEFSAGQLELSAGRATCTTSSMPEEQTVPPLGPPQLQPPTSIATTRLILCGLSFFAAGLLVLAASLGQSREHHTGASAAVATLDPRQSFPPLVPPTLPPDAPSPCSPTPLPILHPPFRSRQPFLHHQCLHRRSAGKVHNLCEPNPASVPSWSHKRSPPRSLHRSPVNTSLPGKPPPDRHQDLLDPINNLQRDIFLSVR